MYKRITFIGIFFLGAYLSAQTPQKVERIVKEMHEKGWYEEQIKAWKSVVDKNPQNGDAWINYYLATRVSGQVSGGPWPHEEMDKIIQNLSIAMPNSFEYHYLSAFNNGKDFDEKFQMLKKAYEADPSRKELNEEFALHYELQRNMAKRKEFNTKWYQSNDLSPHLLAINYNVLVGLDKDAVIFTHGDNDTMPLWLLQDALGVRPDVTVINASLINLPDYRVKIFKHLGISEVKAKDISPKLPDLVKLIDKESNHPIHIVLTVRESMYQPIKSDLYMVGLSSKYSTKRFDNISTLVDNVENKFKLDHINSPFSYLSPTSTIRYHMGTYLAPLMRLQKHYLTSNKMTKAAENELALLQIAELCGRTEEVEKWLSNN